MPSPALKRTHLRSVSRLLEQIGHEVAGLPGPSIDALAPALHEAQKELALDLAQWLRSAAVRDKETGHVVIDAEARFTAQRYRAALAQIDEALARVADLEPAMGKALLDGSHRAGALAVEHVKRELAAWSPEFSGSVAPIPIREAAILAKGDRMLIPRFRTSAARYAGAVGEDIKRQLSIGMVRGESFFEMTNRMQRMGGPRGLVSLRGVLGEPGAVGDNIAEGLFRRYRSWSARVVRTEAMNSYNVAADASIAEVHKLDPEIERRWDATLDMRVCSDCAAMHGETAPVGGTFKGGLSGPPLHPCCRCATLCYRADWTHDLD
jgi:hypothetical protein